MYLHVLVEKASIESLEEMHVFDDKTEKNETASERRFDVSDESMSDESVGSPIINVNNVKVHINMTKPLQILRKEFFNLQKNQTKGNKIMY